MGLGEIDRAAVLRALEEFDLKGREGFLEEHGFAPARTYLLVHEGRSYDSKAIVGVAHGYARPDLGPLGSGDFTGGRTGAVRVLTALGFTVQGADVLESLVSQVSDESAARTCAGFPWGRADLGRPGLYSWWVDEEGANALSAGLGHDVQAGLVYVGQAGAGAEGARRSTLASRIGRNHLRGNPSSSTWRLTLTAALQPVDQAALSEWMHRHLRLIAVPVPGEGLLRLEEQVLARIDPPLNLMHMPTTPLRSALKAARVGRR